MTLNRKFKKFGFGIAAVERGILWTRTLDEHKGGPPLICGQRNVMASARQHRTEHRQMTYAQSQIEVKILDTAAPGIEVRDSTYHARATEKSIFLCY